MTAGELYDADPTFRALVDQWDADRRCPYCLPDRLRDFDLHLQAELAEWIVAEPDKPVYCPLNQWKERGGRCGPYPTTTGSSYRAWFMSFGDWDDQDNFAHRLPADVVWVGADAHGDFEAETPVECLLAVLDSYRGKKPSESLAPAPNEG